MFSLLNMINSISGKYMSSGVLILLTIVVYCFVINQMLDEIYENNMYLTMLIVLMITDIATITYLFVNFSREDIIVKNDDKIQLKDKVKKTNKKKQKTIKNNENKDDMEVKNAEEVIKKDDSQHNIISTFNENYDCSINTFEK